MSQRVVNINIKKELKKEDIIPDAKDFAKKYDIDLDEEEDEDPFLDNINDLSIDNQTEKDFIRGINQNNESYKRIETLVTKLDEKNKEIERLCTLIESIEPVDGIDPEKFLNMIDGKNDQNIVVCFVLILQLRL